MMGLPAVIIRAPEEREKPIDQRPRASRQSAGCFIRNRADFAGVSEVEKLPSDYGQSFVPGDRGEFRIGRAFGVFNSFQRMGETISVIDQLHHHRPLDAKAARLNRVGCLTQDIDNSPALHLHFETAK
jgi:hypothetical protein